MENFENLGRDELLAKCQNMAAQLDAANNSANSYENDLRSIRSVLAQLVNPIINQYLENAFMDYVHDNEYDMRDTLGIDAKIDEGDLQDQIREAIEDMVNRNDLIVSAKLEVK